MLVTVSSYVRSSHFGAMLYRVLRYTVRFFFFPKKKLVRFCCVNGAGSVAMLHHLVPERIPLQKPRNTFFFFEKKKKRLWDERSLGQFVAFNGAVSHYFTVQVDALFHATPGS